MGEEGVEEATGVQCPHCGGTVHINFTTHMPKRQTVQFQIKFEGERLSADTLGSTITNFAELLKLTAKDIGGQVHVFIESLQYGDHTATVEFLILSVRDEAPEQPRPTP